MSPIDWDLRKTAAQRAEEALLEAQARRRAERDNRLRETDWTQLPDAPVDSALWAVYRQALRDITEGEDWHETPMPPAPWLQPSGAHDAYPVGAVVHHNGKLWMGLIPANVWEPGVSGWAEVVLGDEPPPAWVQPTGAHDAYQTGDRVSHNSLVWQSDVDANVWEPGVHGWSTVP